MKTTEFCSHTVRDAIKFIAKIDAQSGIGQETYVIEECAELIKELTKKRRGRCASVLCKRKLDYGSIQTQFTISKKSWVIPKNIMVEGEKHSLSSVFLAKTS